MPAPALFRSVALVAATLLLPPTAWAQRGNVVVDWSALDALGPAAAAPSGAVALRPPPKRPVIAAPAAPAGPSAASTAPIPNKPTPAPAQVAMAPPPRPAPPAPSAAPVPPQAAPSAIPASAPALLPGRAAMIRFAPGHSDMPAEGRDVLDRMAAQLAANGKLRLQLVGYASGSGDDAVEARRISLQRAVQMRSYLIAKGVQSVRMDVRALGSLNNGGDAPDRVDLVILDH